YLDVADPSQALDAYRQSHDLNVAAGERRGAALALYFAGSTLQTAGQHSQALEELHRALGTLRDLGDRRVAGRGLIAIRTAQAALGQYGNADGSLREAIGLVSGLYYEAQAWEALAGIASQSGDQEAARQCLQEALGIYTSTRHP